MDTTDIVIIGSGIGGATIASVLAGQRARIVILERGDFLFPSPQAKDAVAIFQQGYYRNSEEWYDNQGKAYQAGNYYYVGGNSKFYGAAMVRYRKEDFAELAHPDGVSPLASPLFYELFSRPLFAPSVVRLYCHNGTVANGSVFIAIILHLVILMLNYYCCHYKEN